MPFAKRFIGVENLPTKLSEFDVQQALGSSYFSCKLVRFASETLYLTTT